MGKYDEIKEFNKLIAVETIKIRLNDNSHLEIMDFINTQDCFTEDLKNRLEMPVFLVNQQLNEDFNNEEVYTIINGNDIHIQDLNRNVLAVILVEEDTIRKIYPYRKSRNAIILSLINKAYSLIPDSQKEFLVGVDKEEKVLNYLIKILED